MSLEGFPFFLAVAMYCYEVGAWRVDIGPWDILYSQVNVTKFNIDSGNGLVLLGNKPLAEAVLIKIFLPYNVTRP